MVLIHSRVVIYSETVEIFAGKQEKARLKGMSISSKPSLFADFVSWLYTGEFLKLKNHVL